jgi:hypothetical protein
MRTKGPLIESISGSAIKLWEYRLVHAGTSLSGHNIVPVAGYLYAPPLFQFFFHCR